MTAKRPRVLVVDDTKGLMTMEVDQQVRESFELLTATTAAEAMNLLEAHEPDAVIIDRDLPDEDGFELTRRIRALTDRIAILIASPFSHAAEVAAARRVGAQNVIQKPILSDAFRTLVFDAINVNARRQKRVSAEIEIDYSDGDHEFLDKSLNLSAAGIFIRTGAPLQLGTDVKLSFRLPGIQRAIEVAGVVAWVQQHRPDGPAEQYPGMGISFFEVSEQDTQDLQRYVKEQLVELGLTDD